jgi:hypothetical protein
MFGDWWRRLRNWLAPERSGVSTTRAPKPPAVWQSLAVAPAITEATQTMPPVSHSGGINGAIDVTTGEPIDGWRFRRADVEQGGTFYFHGDLLEQLPKYFKVIARLKGVDRSSYELFSRTGATLLPTKALVAYTREFPAIWHNKQTRPAFGAITLALDLKDDERFMYARLMYFNKIKRPSHVEPTTGDTYEILAYFDMAETNGRWPNGKRMPKWLRKAGCVAHFHISVSDSGDCQLLKELRTDWQKINYRALNENNVKALYTEHIPQKRWAYPPVLVDWFRDYQERFKDEWRERTVEEYAIYLARMIAEWALAVETGIRVEVMDGNGHAGAFAVDMKRTAYFFKNREVVLSPKGGKARIFHIVKPHSRRLKNGKLLNCRMHFRGLRSFAWGGYNVHITVPGLHHTPLSEFIGASFYAEQAKELGIDLKHAVDHRKFAKTIHEQIHQ